MDRTGTQPEHVGTELKLLLARCGIQSTGACQCDTRALLMDEMGGDWCRENIEVIVGWLREAAESEGRWCYADAVARLLVLRAIRNARRKVRHRRRSTGRD